MSGYSFDFTYWTNCEVIKIFIHGAAVESELVEVLWRLGRVRWDRQEKIHDFVIYISFLNIEVTIYSWLISDTLVIIVVVSFITLLIFLASCVFSVLLLSWYIVWWWWFWGPEIIWKGQVFLFILRFLHIINTSMWWSVWKISIFMWRSMGEVSIFMWRSMGEIWAHSAFLLVIQLS